jgi:hypothetical protein
MALCKIVALLVGYLFVSRLTLAQGNSPDSPSVSTASAANHEDFSKTVLPITEVKFVGLGIEGKFGTGFCLDPECRFIGTNYHVAAKSGARKIRGQKVVERYLATGPKDEGATVNDGFTGPTKYTLSRDLALFELRHPLPQYHGMAFSLNDLQIGQDIDIYAFPREGITPFRSLVQFHGKFKGETPTGLLAFEYRLSGDKSIRPGASGGLVVDTKTQRIVGILNQVAKSGEAVAFAVPVESLADFVRRVQPTLAQRIFPSPTGISATSADLYPKFLPSHPANVLRQRPEEPAEVTLLRRKAQSLADSIRNFVAVQSFAWGKGDNDPSAVAAYEVQVLGGYQKFREYPDGKKEFADVPFPRLNTSLTPSGEWSELPAMVGTELDLKIQQAADVMVNERQIKVFQYRADAEDGVCKFRSMLDLVFFVSNKIFNVACYGEVWTDEDTNILRMSRHVETQGGWWKDYQTVVTYGWLRRKDQAPRLIPLTIAAQIGFRKKVYWCRGQFTDYKEFGSKVKILPGSLAP